MTSNVTGSTSASAVSCSGRRGSTDSVAGGTYPRATPLGRLERRRRGGAVAPRVLGGEVAGQAGAPAVRQVDEHLQAVHQLLGVAHQRPDLEPRLGAGARRHHGLTGPADGPVDLASQRHVLEGRPQGRLDLGEPGDVAGRDAVGGQGGRAVAERDEHLPHADLGCVAERVHRARPAVGVQDEVARVQAALQGLLPDQGRRPQVVHGDDAGRGLLQAQAKLTGQPADRRPGGLLVQRHPAAEEAAWSQQAEHHVRVGDGGQRPAPAVTGRPRLRPGAVRAHPQRPGPRVTPGDGAASARGGPDVQMRHAVGVLVDDRLVGHRRPPVHDQPDVEGGAAHVGGHHVRVPAGRRQRSHPGQPGGGSGVQRAQRHLGRDRGRHNPAAGLHDQ
jgi:hypothetical protein